jgi:hypothetical protein
VQASLGAPLDMSRYADSPVTIDALRSITNQTMRAVRAEVAVVRGLTPPDVFFRPNGKTRAG